MPTLAAPGTQGKGKPRGTKQSARMYILNERSWLDKGKQRLMTNWKLE